MMSRIRAWVESLARGAAPGLDWLGAEAGSLSVDSVPTSPRVRRYLRGGGRGKLDFVVSGREFLDGDTAAAAENLRFFEELGRAMDGAELPNLGEGYVPERAEVLSTAYPVSADGHGTARYQMQCRIYYYESNHDRGAGS